MRIQLVASTRILINDSELARIGDENIGIGATPSHTYTIAGIYDVCLTVSDGNVISDEVCTITVVYDPDGGFVTGGGWIDSHAGAYAHF